MKKIRESVFETNSSSTHCLTYNFGSREDYVPKSKHIKIRWIDTNDESVLSSLTDKVSYLVSHIANYHKYNVNTYDELLEEINNDWDFKRVRDYVRDNFEKEILFPESYDGDIEELVDINHQLYERDFDCLLEDIVSEHHDYLHEILSDKSIIEIGRD